MKKLLCLVFLTSMIVGCSFKVKENEKNGVNSDYILEMLTNVDNSQIIEEKGTDKDAMDKETEDESNTPNEKDTTKSNDK